MACIEAVTGEELSSRGSIDADIVCVSVEAVDRAGWVVVEGDSQVVRGSTLSIEYDIVVLGGVNILAGFADADVGLYDGETVLFGECIYAATVAMVC